MGERVSIPDYKARVLTVFLFKYIECIDMPPELVLMIGLRTDSLYTRCSSCQELIPIGDPPHCHQGPAGRDLVGVYPSPTMIGLVGYTLW